MRLSFKGVLHTGALGFTAFWLIATSAPEERGAGTCYEGLSPEATVEIVLGERFPATTPISRGRVELPDGGVVEEFRTPPSCAAIDGLARGAPVRLDVTAGSDELGCGYYATESVDGATGVSRAEGFRTGLVAHATGTFQSNPSGASACRGTWTFEVSLASDGLRRGPTNVLEAAHEGRLLVRRTIKLGDARFCPELEETGPLECFDGFVVDSLKELP